MSRLPYLHAEDLEGPARDLFETISGPRPDLSLNAQGGLEGPFNAWVYVPALARPLLEAGTVLLGGTTLERRLVELAIITTGAHFRAEFEWWAHARLARRHGVADEVIEAIADGREPSFADPDARVVHTAARELASTGTLTAATCAEARALFGDAATVELVTVCGYYALISYTLNAFDVPVPEGVPTRWASPGGAD